MQENKTGQGTPACGLKVIPVLLTEEQGTGTLDIPMETNTHLTMRNTAVACTFKIDK